MAKPLLSNVHVHITDTLEKCWTCADLTPGNTFVGGNTLTLKDPDKGIIVCPRCSKEKIV